MNNTPRKKGIFLRLSKYVLKQWYFFIPAVILTLVSNQLSLLGPKYSGIAIDAIKTSGDVDFPIVYENIIKMIGCYVLSALFAYVLALLMIRLSQNISYGMRKQLFEKLNTLPVGYFDTHATGDIISHLCYDVDTINSTLSHDLIQVMTSIYIVLGSAVYMWRISPVLFLVFALTVPVSVFFARYRSKKVRPLFRERSKKYGELNGYAEEMFTGARTIEAYGNEEVFSSRFNSHNKSAMDAYYKADYQAAMLFPTINFINNISLTLVAVFGGLLYMYSENGVILETSLFFITLGGVAQFVQYSRKFAGPINEFSNIIHEFQSAFSAAERVFRVLDEEEETPDAQNACHLEKVHGQIDFGSVTFGYTADKVILEDFTLNVKSGQTVAIVGPTGAGKTTIINLLMRFYDTNSGEILMDGKKITDVVRRDWRGAFTMVLQDTWLFHGSVFDNIAYGREDVTPDEVYAAARAAKIDSYIETLPDGYDTILTDDGVNISKGQKQLITIARAFLSKAPILILDEATSNVDSRTEMMIQEAMSELMKGKTSFVIAHRLSTIKNADVILVVKDGSIIERGTHEELLSKKGFYATLYNSQFS